MKFEEYAVDYFSRKKILFDGGEAYDNLTYEEQEKARNALRVKIKKVLYVIFKEWHGKRFLLLIRDDAKISPTEAKFYDYLLDHFDTSMGKEESKKLFCRLTQDRWDIFPKEIRKKHLKEILKLANQEGDLLKYLKLDTLHPSNEYVYDQLVAKILHPSYYRLTHNLRQIQNVLEEGLRKWMEKFDPLYFIEFDAIMREFASRCCEGMTSIMIFPLISDKEFERLIRKSKKTMRNILKEEKENETEWSRIQEEKENLLYPHFMNILNNFLQVKTLFLTCEREKVLNNFSERWLTYCAAYVDKILRESEKKTNYQLHPYPTTSGKVDIYIKKSGVKIVNSDIYRSYLEDAWNDRKM